MTWTTDVGSDTLVDFGTGAGPYIPAWSQATSTDTSSPGVTSHSQTVTGLLPGILFTTYLRSRPFIGGSIDTNKAHWGQVDGTGCPDGGTCSCLIPGVSLSGSTYNFVMQVQGTQNIVQGYDTYLQLTYSDIARPSSWSSSFMNATLGISGGLPTGMTISMYDPYGFVASYNQSTGALVLNPSNGEQDTAIHIQTTSSTPIGTYTLNISNAHQTNYPGTVNSYRYTFNVVAPDTVVGESMTFPYGVPSSYPSIPDIGNASTSGTWIYGMVTEGATSYFCTQGASGLDAGANFYDAIRAYQQTQTYDTLHSITGNPSQWNTCIADRENGYVLYINSTNPAGGIESIYLGSKAMATLALNGDSTARTALFETADNAEYKTLRGAIINPDYEREKNFTLEAFIAANKAGDSNEASLIPVGIDYILTDIDEAIHDTASGCSMSYCSMSHEMFLDGLLADTLIHYYTDNGSQDKRIPAAIKEFADYLWDNYWIVGTCSGSSGGGYFTGCFAYEAGTYQLGIDAATNQTPNNDANLNLLLAPMYAWLFKMTGNKAIPGSDGSQCMAGGGTAGQPCSYQQAGDTIWASGVTQQDWYDSKNWAQQYRWSFDYVTWRSAP